MFTERYFTEQDANAVAAMLALMFPEIQFEVRYQGTYGEPGKPDKQAYWLVFKQEQWGLRWISTFPNLALWLEDELGEEQGNQVADLIRSVAIEDIRDSSQKLCDEPHS